jgi:hypothetical protein
MLRITYKFPETVEGALPQNESKLERRMAVNRLRSV